MALKNMSLERLAKKLSRLVNEKAPKHDLKPVYYLMHQRLKARIRRISGKGYSWAAPFEHFLPKPELFVHGECLVGVLNGLDVSRFFKRDVDVIYNHEKAAGNLEEVLYDKKAGEWIGCLRIDRKIIFENPYALSRLKNPSSLSRPKVQSWGGPIILPYSKHYNGSGNPNASKYIKGINRKAAEMAVFNHGIGYLDPNSPHNRMYLFLAFTDTIGYDRLSNPTNIIRIQVDRQPSLRKGGKGYVSGIHGNPITETELKKCLKQKANYIFGNCFDAGLVMK